MENPVFVYTTEDWSGSVVSEFRDKLQYTKYSVTTGIFTNPSYKQLSDDTWHFFSIDTNGFNNGPNQVGVDYFIIETLVNNVVPAGLLIKTL